MALSPYILESKHNICLALIGQALWFILLAAELNEDPFTLLTILFTCVALLYSLEKETAFGNPSEKYVGISIRLAILCLCLFLTIVLSFENNPITEAIVISYNTTAYTAVYSEKLAWIASIPLLAMCLSGIYITKRSYRLSYYLAVAFISLITVQAVSFFTIFLSWEYLCFPKSTPFIGSNFFGNIVFLIMAAVILPPKQIPVISKTDNFYTDCEFTQEEVDALVVEIIELVHSAQT